MKKLFFISAVLVSNFISAAQISNSNINKLCSKNTNEESFTFLYSDSDSEIFNANLIGKINCSSKEISLTYSTKISNSLKADKECSNFENFSDIYKCRDSFYEIKQMPISSEDLIIKDDGSLVVTIKNVQVGIDDFSEEMNGLFVDAEKVEFEFNASSLRFNKYVSAFENSEGKITLSLNPKKMISAMKKAFPNKLSNEDEARLKAKASEGVVDDEIVSFNSMSVLPFAENLILSNTSDIYEVVETDLQVTDLFNFIINSAAK